MYFQNKQNKYFSLIKNGRFYSCFRLFESNAELLNMFTNFKHLKTKDEQSTSQELAEHALKVMTTLDEGIKGLDDMDAFLSYLHQVGASHRRIPDFNRQYFWVRYLFIL